jgi:hypothetical protein
MFIGRWVGDLEDAEAEDRHGDAVVEGDIVHDRRLWRWMGVAGLVD